MISLRLEQVPNPYRNDPIVGGVARVQRAVEAQHGPAVLLVPIIPRPVLASVQYRVHVPHSVVVLETVASK